MSRNNKVRHRKQKNILEYKKPKVMYVCSNCGAYLNTPGKKANGDLYCTPCLIKTSTFYVVKQFKKSKK